MKKMLFSGGAAFLMSVGLAQAADPPAAKEGLWSSHSQTVDQPGNKKSEATKTVCRNHAYDQSRRIATRGHQKRRRENHQYLETLAKPLRFAAWVDTGEVVAPGRCARITYC